jgi:stalled ribosome rescue protein Dom34
MNRHFHYAVWIDHQQARILSFDAQSVDSTVVHAHDAHQHLRHKANTIGSGHAPEDQHYYEAVAQALAKAGAVLVMGPANAKTEFMKHIEKHEPKLVSIVSAAEKADHMTDPEIVAHARQFFKIDDRMHPQK